jgi:hypothetical protein
VERVIRWNVESDGELSKGAAPLSFSLSDSQTPPKFFQKVFKKSGPQQSGINLMLH